MIEQFRRALDARTLAPPLPVPPKAAAIGRWWACQRTAVLQATVLVVALRVALTIVGLLALGLLPPQSGLHDTYHRSSYPFLDIWARWDSEYYLDIAQHGYGWRPELLLFYPLYPLLVRVSTVVLGNHYVLSGVAVSSLAFLVALVYLFRLAALELGERAAGRAAFYLAIFPTALFALAVYTESLFLALSLATFYYARRGQWWWVALAALLASLTRGNGFVLAFPLAYEAWKQAGSLRRLRPASLVAMVAAPFGMALWAGYLAWMRHDLLAVVDIRSIPPFRRVSTLPWQPLEMAVRILADPHQTPLSRAVNAGDLTATLLILSACVLAWRRLPRLYAIYLAATLLVLLGSAVSGWPLQSMQRYALSLFPIFFLLAQLGANRHWDRVIVLSCAPLLGLYMALFAQWYWVF